MLCISVVVDVVNESINQVPYLILSSLSFTLPFFFIVGFDNVGDTTTKFFWYWLFQGLYMSVLVYMGQFFAAIMPTKPAADGKQNNKIEDVDSSS